MKVDWSEPAEEDLDAIVEYIARENLQAALDMDGLLRNSADELAVFAERGKPGRIPGTRELIVHKNYILVYVLTPDAVQIVTVLHAARQWPPKKREDAGDLQ
ncbi:MAG: type II toxin-antitoxin system RelE/ParE family toxin [Desulfovibrio sp.]|jgi:addiction module RelE/StbE family toxin|nr:type II toxin-antitoxin system RelE/ParE family toxin [Desulfovibrio sp.]